MKKLTMVLGIAAMGAMPMTMVACGEDPDPTAIKTCTSGADCQSTEFCHPVGQICMTICTDATGCDANHPTCAAVKDAAGKDSTVLVCQCSSSSCGADQVCNSTDQHCGPKCTDDTGCGGYTARKCDTAKSECSAGGAGCKADADCKDAAKPLCVAGACIAKCTKDADCTDATNKFCDLGTGKCGATAKCDPTKTAPGAAGGPDICKNDEFCDATTKECKPAGGTCAAKTAYGAKTGASIPYAYNVTKTGQRTTTLTTACPPGNVNQFKGFWYDKEGDMPTANLFTGGNIRVVSKTGAKGDTFQNLSVTKNADGKSGEFTFELCTDTVGNIEAVYLKDSAGNEGNAACFTQ